MPEFSTRVSCWLGRGDVLFEWYEGPAPADTPREYAAAAHAQLVRLREGGTPPPGWPKTAAEWSGCRLIRLQVYPAGHVGGLPLAERDF